MPLYEYEDSKKRMKKEEFPNQGTLLCVCLIWFVVIECVVLDITLKDDRLENNNPKANFIKKAPI